MPKATWGTGYETLVDREMEREFQREDRLRHIDMQQQTKKARIADYSGAEPGPGQFVVRWGFKCEDCGAFVKKGEVAGYDSEDNKVCEDCHQVYQY